MNKACSKFTKNLNFELLKHLQCYPFINAEGKKNHSPTSRNTLGGIFRPTSHREVGKITQVAQSGEVAQKTGYQLYTVNGKMFIYLPHHSSDPNVYVILSADTPPLSVDVLLEAFYLHWQEFYH